MQKQGAVQFWKLEGKMVSGRICVHTIGFLVFNLFLLFFYRVRSHIFVPGQLQFICCVLSCNKGKPEVLLTCLHTLAILAFSSPWSCGWSFGAIMFIYIILYVHWTWLARARDWWGQHPRNKHWKESDRIRSQVSDPPPMLNKHWEESTDHRCTQDWKPWQIS